MEERIEYQVLAPDSVAWFIQAALTADRSGNAHSRDLALAEAQRIAEERRLVEGPAPDGSRVLCYDVAHECNGVRLAAIEKIISSLHEHQVLDARRVEKLETSQLIDHRTMHATFNEHQARLEALEQGPRYTMHEQQRVDDITARLRNVLEKVDALEYIVRNLQRLAQSDHWPEVGL